MPKNAYSKREDLICGKIDALALKIKQLSISDLEKAEIIDLLSDIQYDAQRMESKLIIRKQQFDDLNKTS